MFQNLRWLPMTRDDFIEKVGALAVADYPKSRVLPSLTIAQAILESGWGKSGLTVNANALFGIKAGKDWKGKRVNCKTFEYYDGERVDIVDCFRAYDSWTESVADHGAFLAGLSRYKAVIGEQDYRKACQAIQAAGYATAPNYAEVLTGLIEQYGLVRFDKAALPGKYGLWIGHFAEEERAMRISGALSELGIYNKVAKETGGYVIRVGWYTDQAKADALALLLKEQCYSEMISMS